MGLLECVDALLKLDIAGWELSLLTSLTQLLANELLGPLGKGRERRLEILSEALNLIHDEC